jgi:iduronate 2-sulfatase
MLLIVLLVALLHVGRAAPSAQVPARPNVLFIAIDDLRPSLGCYGDTLVTSPHIDRLAETGLQFGRAYCQQAVCGPSRTSMLTGLLPDKTRVWHNRNLFRDTHPDIVTLPQLFKKHGYHTQSLGKVFSGRTREDDPASWSMPSVLIGEGWQSYVLPENQGSGKQSPTEIADVPDDAYRDGQLAKLAIETLENLKRQARPFFLAVGFFKPHLPFNAPKAYWDRYDPAVFRAQALGARTRGAPDAAYPDHLELGGYRGVPKDERVSPEQACRLRHGYYACVSYVDAQVGKVLSALERLGLAGNTIVVLWGDHGYSLGEANHWCKDTNFELDTRVPLIMRVPGVTTRGAAGRHQPGPDPTGPAPARTGACAQPVLPAVQTEFTEGHGLFHTYRYSSLYALDPVARAHAHGRGTLRLHICGRCSAHGCVSGGATKPSSGSRLCRDQGPAPSSHG